MGAKLDAATVGMDVTEDFALNGLDRSDRLLYIEVLVWSCARDTDGFLPAAMLDRMSDHPDKVAAVGRLVEVGRLAVEDGGWSIVGFDRTQLASTVKEEMREKGRERSRGFQRHTRGQHGSWCPRTCKERDVHVVNDDVNTQRIHKVRSVAKRSVASATTGLARSAPSGLRPPVAPLATTDGQDDEPKPLAKDDEGFSALYDAQDENHAPCAVCGRIGDVGEMLTATFEDGDSELVHEACGDDPRVVEVTE